jgi:hypothetical protein
MRSRQNRALGCSSKGSRSSWTAARPTSRCGPPGPRPRADGARTSRRGARSARTLPGHHGPGRGLAWARRPRRAGRSRAAQLRGAPGRACWATRSCSADEGYGHLSFQDPGACVDEAMARYLTGLIMPAQGHCLPVRSRTLRPEFQLCRVTPQVPGRGMKFRGRVRGVSRYVAWGEGRGWRCGSPPDHDPHRRRPPG